MKNSALEQIIAVLNAINMKTLTNSDRYVNNKIKAQLL